MRSDINKPRLTDAVTTLTVETQPKQTEELIEVESNAKSKSAATVLVNMALAAYDFGISTVGEAFALPKSGPKIVALLRGSKTSLRGKLARNYFRATSRAASQQALADALACLDGMAQESEATELFLRVARNKDALWVRKPGSLTSISTVLPRTSRPS